MYEISRKTRPSFASGFARSSAEAENPGLWKDCIFHWDASLGVTGQRAVDVSGKKNHGTFYNMDGDNWVPSPNGWAINVDADLELVKLPIKINPALPYTFSCLRRWPAISGSHADGCRSATNRFYVGIYSGTKAFVGVGNTFSTTVNHGMSASVWYRITLICDGSKAYFYRDSTLVTSFNYTTAGEIPYPFWLGGMNKSNAIEDDNTGDMQNVTLWKKALTSSELKQLCDDRWAMTRQRPRIFAVTSRQKRWPWQTRRQRRMTGAR